MNKRAIMALFLATMQVGTMATTTYGMNTANMTVIHTEPIIKPIGEHTITIDLGAGTIFLNGTRLKGSKCLVKDDISYVPLKTIVSSIYDGTITYNKSTNDVEANIEGLSFKYKIGNKQGSKNGVPNFIELPMIMEKGVVYCPIKALPNLFNLKMVYNASEKKITLTGPERFKPEVISSFADFEFGAESYIQGQNVTVVDKSYDVLGMNIIDKVWMLDGDKTKTSSNFTSLFDGITPGMHNVSLKVKCSNGTWSEWTTKALSIIENAKPVVTEIKSDKEAYAQGDKISLEFTYENEEWEEIKEEKWYYKRVGEDDKSKVYAKPERIFYPGEYEVGLELKDSFGNWSDVYTWTLHITDEVKDTELNFKFTQNEPGTIIDNYEGRNYRDFEQIELTKTGMTEGTNILSDSPENVVKNGILYEDYVEGKGRINFHHINTYEGSKKNKKIVVMAENTTSEPITITIMDKIIKGPSIDALYVGQLLLFQYFRGNGYTYYTLQPGEKTFLINTEDKNWDANMLLAGQMDLHTTGPVKFTIAAMDKGMTTANMPYLPYLNIDNHPRGTFDTTDLFYEVTAPAGKETYFILGGNNDEWCTGTDGITKRPVVNVGNYGVVYHIKLTAEEDMGIMLNPRGGGFRGAVRIDGKYTYLIPKTSYLTGDNTKAAVITTVKKGQTIEMEYSLPNGSAAPVLIGMIPKSFWKKK